MENKETLTTAMMKDTSLHQALSGIVEVIESRTNSHNAHFDMCMLYLDLFFISTHGDNVDFHSHTRTAVDANMIYGFEHDALRQLEALDHRGVKPSSLMPVPDEFRIQLDPRVFPQRETGAMGEEFSHMTSNMMQVQPINKKSRPEAASLKTPIHPDERINLRSLRVAGHSIKFTRILKQESSLRNTSSLHYLAHTGQFAKLKLRLDAGSDVNEMNVASTWTPLQYAAAQGHLKVLRLLLNRGAQLLIQKSFSAPALHLAAAAGHIPVLKELLQHYQQQPKVEEDKSATPQKSVVNGLNARSSNDALYDRHGAHPLHYACATGHIDTIKYLLEAEPKSLHFKTEYGDTPLHYACLFGQLQAAQYLLEQGAEANATNEKQYTPLLALADRQIIVRCVRAIAIHTKQVQNAILPDISFKTLNNMVQLLKKHGADLNAQDKKQSTALLRCILQPNPALFSILLEQGADVNKADEHKVSPLFCSLSRGMSNMAMALIQNKNIDIHVRDKNGFTALFPAAITGELRLVKACVEAGLDVNDNKNELSTTPLIRLCIRTQSTAMRAFKSRYKAGLLASAQYTDESFKFYQVIEYLLQQGASTEARNQRGYTALLHAASNGDYKACELLLQYGADVNARDIKYQDTPLHVLCYMGRLETPGMLLPTYETSLSPRVADVFKKDNTPPRYLKTAQVLARSGADLSLHNKNKSTPFSIAHSCEHTTKELKDFFLSAAEQFLNKNKKASPTAEQNPPADQSPPPKTPTDNTQASPSA